MSKFANKFTVGEDFKRSNVYAHVLLEFECVYSDDEMQVAMLQCVLELLEKFYEQGHSGMSSAYALGVFSKLANFEPLGPLTGADEEWVNLGYDDNMTHQNKRCPHVFKGKKGAYDSTYYIFVDPNGSGCTNGQSRKYIEFPYTPERVHVPRDEHDNPLWDQASEPKPC